MNYTLKSATILELPSDPKIANPIFSVQIITLCSDLYGSTLTNNVPLTIPKSTKLENTQQAINVVATEWIHTTYPDY